MERYKRCTVRVNKKLVKREVIYKYGSITNYCKENNISLVRYYEIVNNPHNSALEECLLKLSGNLNLSIDEILM